jgi:hypothetical protein
MEVSGQYNALATLTPGKEPLDRRLGGPQSQCGWYGVEKKLMPPPLGIEPHPSSLYPVTILTEFSWLLMSKMFVY